MVSVISDESCDEGFTDDDISENMGRGIQYCQISIRYRIVQSLKRRVKMMNNKSWICQICNNKYEKWP